MNVSIFGSCVSRDALNFDANGQFQLVSYFARSSLASAFHPIKIVDTYSEKLDSKFQQRIVHADFQKLFSSTLAAQKFDVLLLDVIDERFNLFAFEEGGFCTVSNELINAGFNQSRPRGETIRSGTDGFFRLWEQGWMELLAQLEASNQLSRLRINQVYWSRLDADGVGYQPAYTESRIDEANQFLRCLYQRMAQDLPSTQFLSFKPTVLVGATDHRWGRSPFHYIREYYDSLLMQMAQDDTLAVAAN